MVTRETDTRMRRSQADSRGEQIIAPSGFGSDMVARVSAPPAWRRTSAGATTRPATFSIWGQDAIGTGDWAGSHDDVSEGMVVLDAVHPVQARRRASRRAAGTARQASAGRARRRSTASRSSYVHDAVERAGSFGSR